MARKCIHCESRKAMTRFENETFTIEHAGARIKLEGLSGWRCGACGEVEFDADSARRYAAAGDELVLRERAQQSKDIRRIRRKLGLSQVAAARLTGGGHNAFSRYERGEATPSNQSVPAPGQTSGITEGSRQIHQGIEKEPIAVILKSRLWLGAPKHR
jgi:HTH-type transcriptional regulator/antitoxin MqsA